MKGLTLMLVLFICSFVKGQVGSVGIGTSAPNHSAVLDVFSSSKGILIPRLTIPQMYGITDPATGLLIYQTSLNRFQYFNGTAWRPLDPWNWSRNSICYTEGNVGIGICNPTILLHLRSDTSDVQLGFSNSLSKYIVGIDETEGSFYIGEDSTNGLTKDLVIRNHRIGIGTASPNSALHIKGTSFPAVIRFSHNNTTKQYIVGIDETEGSFRFYYDSLGTLKTRMLIDSAGRVGIGIVNTTAKLNVDGKLMAKEIELNDGLGNSVVYSAANSPAIIEAVDLYRTANFSYNTSFTDIQWNNNRISPAVTSMSFSGAVVTINKTGLYQITYALTGEESNKLTTTRLMKDSGSGYAEVASSQGFAAHEGSNSIRYGTATRTFIMLLNIGDKLKLQAKADSGSITGVPEGSSFTLVKLK